jgi:hypothetical protein
MIAVDNQYLSPHGGMLPPDQRQAILSRAVQDAVARGGRIQYADQFSAVVIYGKPVNHVLHLLITILLLGLWLIVWILIALTGGEKRELIAVDEWGRILRRPA